MTKIVEIKSVKMFEEIFGQPTECEDSIKFIDDHKPPRLVRVDPFEILKHDISLFTEKQLIDILNDPKKIYNLIEQEILKRKTT